jgi:hypothetical protein
MAFLREKWLREQQQQISGQDLFIMPEMPEILKEKQITKTKSKVKYEDISSDEEDNFYEWVINNNPSINKFRKVLKKHIEELEDNN